MASLISNLCSFFRNFITVTELFLHLISYHFSFISYHYSVIFIIIHLFLIRSAIISFRFVFISFLFVTVCQRICVHILFLFSLSGGAHRVTQLLPYSPVIIIFIFKSSTIGMVPFAEHWNVTDTYFLLNKALFFLDWKI